MLEEMIPTKISFPKLHLTTPEKASTGRFFSK